MFKRVNQVQMLPIVLLTACLCAACAGSTAGPSTPVTLPDAAATQQPPTAVPTATPRPIRVIKTSAAANVISNEDYPFSNCSGTVSLSQPFSEVAQVSAEVVISDQATRSDGTVIAVDETRRAELAREVELAYEPELAAARAAVDEEELVAAPFTRWNVVIVWEDRVFAATVSYPGDGATAGVAPLTATAAYTYTQHVPSVAYYKTMFCTA